MRVTLDANVLVRAHPRSRSAGRKLLLALIDGGHEVLLSSAIIVETLKVLRYPRLQGRFGMTDEELYDYGQFLRDVAQIVILSEPYTAPRLRRCVVYQR